MEALTRNRAFVDNYTDARPLATGRCRRVPAGTCWLQRFASVSILQT
jgi:hypothetical protein